MDVKNIRETEYFRSTDDCMITETFGIPSEGIKEASVAYAILPKHQKTNEHRHNFLEWYIITNGKGLMYINNEKKEIKIGDNILIKKNNWHYIENISNDNLEFYCFCVPAFSLEGTTMKNGSKATENIKRDFTVKI